MKRKVGLAEVSGQPAAPRSRRASQLFIVFFHDTFYRRNLFSLLTNRTPKKKIMTQKIIETLLLCLVIFVMASSYSLQTKNTRTSTSQQQRSRRPLRLMPVEDLSTLSESPFSSTSVPSDYVYVPPEVGADIYIATVCAVLPFIWASIKFGNRIKIQQNCLVCKGNLVTTNLS